jgi:hypothetical protein
VRGYLSIVDKVARCGVPSDLCAMIEARPREKTSLKRLRGEVIKRRT